MGCGSSTRHDVIAISGSLRQDSYNTGLLRYLQSLPFDSEIEFVPIHDLPIFNTDLEIQNSNPSFQPSCAHADIPQSVRVFRDRIRKADVIIFASPEYNGAVSGVLKNAFDWASRDEKTPFREPSPLTGKKMGNQEGIVSTSYLLTLGQVEDLKRMGSYHSCRFYQSDYTVKISRTVFDEHGNVISDSEKRRLREWLEGFSRFLNEKAPSH